MHLKSPQKVLFVHVHTYVGTYFESANTLCIRKSTYFIFTFVRIYMYIPTYVTPPNLRVYLQWKVSKICHISYWNITKKPKVAFIVFNFEAFCTGQFHQPWTSYISEEWCKYFKRKEAGVHCLARPSYFKIEACWVVVLKMIVQCLYTFEIFSSLPISGR